MPDPQKPAPPPVADGYKMLQKLVKDSAANQAPQPGPPPIDTGSIGGLLKSLISRSGLVRPVLPEENPIEGQDFAYPPDFRPGQVRTDVPIDLDAERGAESINVDRSIGPSPYNASIVRDKRPGMLNARFPRTDINLPNDELEDKTDDSGRVVSRHRRRQ